MGIDWVFVGHVFTSEVFWEAVAALASVGALWGLIVSIRKLIVQTKANQDAVEETRKQRLLELIPIVVVEDYVGTEFKEKPTRKLRFRNIGRGTAFHINVEHHQFGDADIVWSTGQYLQGNDADTHLPFKVVKNGTIGHGSSEVQNIFTVLINTKPTVLSLPMRITYKDAVGATYITSMTVSFEKSGLVGVHYHDTIRDGKSIFESQ